MENCIFCDLVRTEKQGLLYEDSRCIAVLDRFPVSRGHALVISKEHAQDLTFVTDETLAQMALVVKKIAKRIDEKLKPDGIKIVSNIREPAGQGIMHLHIHVIPVYRSNDGKDRLAMEVGAQARMANNPKELAAKDKKELLAQLKL